MLRSASQYSPSSPLAHWTDRQDRPQNSPSNSLTREILPVRAMLMHSQRPSTPVHSQIAKPMAVQNLLAAQGRANPQKGALAQPCAAICRVTAVHSQQLRRAGLPGTSPLASRHGMPGSEPCCHPPQRVHSALSFLIPSHTHGIASGKQVGRTIDAVSINL